MFKVHVFKFRLNILIIVISPCLLSTVCVPVERVQVVHCRVAGAKRMSNDPSGGALKQTNKQFFFALVLV